VYYVLFLFQADRSQVYFGGGGGVQPGEYTGIGDVQAFQFAFAMKLAFESTGISSFQNLENKGWLSGSSANTFVANHDTERESILFLD
jgi:hypothetical protein